MIIHSDTTGITYDDMDCVFYRNATQSAWMMSKNCRLIDVFESNMKVVFAFTKEDHQKFIQEWVQRKKELEAQVNNVGG